MSGIMFGAALKGLGDGITSLGSSAMNFESDDERRRLQEQMLRERLDSSERNVDARIAAKLGGSGSGGTKGVIDYKEGSQGEETLAADMGMTVPELRRFRAANKTGDMSGYETEQPVPNGDNVMDPRDSMVAENKTTRGVTSATQKYLSEKRKMLGEITRMYQQGDAYDDSAKGRETVQKMDAAKGIMSGTIAPQKVSQAYLATEAKGLTDNLGESGTFGKSGEGQQLNELGQAKATEERARAAKATASAKDDSLQTIQQLRKSAEETLKDARRALTEFDKLNPVDVSKPGKEKLKAQRDALVEDISSARNGLNEVSARLENRLKDKDGKSGKGGKSDQPPPSDAKPSPAQNPSPEKSASRTVSSLPPGAKQIGTSGGKPVYQTPDGRRFIPS
ncbi:MAG: hypothetical protein EKK53_21625 [Burkholderiales bacterium]|nr:MAG: hypothetical protein EKK53_21625 [Burkholderiales bacterium]